MYLYMSGLEVNKILASIILAVLIVTLIGHFGDLVIDIDHDENDLMEKYHIQAVPTTVFEVDGKEINRFTGPKTKQEVLDRLA